MLDGSRQCVAEFGHAALALVFAPCCASCRSLLEHPLEGPVCRACWRSLRLITPPCCDTCGDPLPSWRVISQALRECPRCRRRTPAVDRGRAVGPYEGVLRDVVHALKYEGRRSLAKPLAGLMRAHCGDVLVGAEAVVPVPLHWRRRQARGFNQAADLAGHLGLPVRHVLARRRWTPPQTGLPAARRHGNVRGAFAVRTPWLRAPWRKAVEPLRDQCLVLVDDVSTTGATLEACARVLKGAGAREVRAVTAARVARPPLVSCNSDSRHDSRAGSPANATGVARDR